MLFGYAIIEVGVVSLNPNFLVAVVVVLGSTLALLARARALCPRGVCRFVWMMFRFREP